MASTAANLVEHVLPPSPLRQWVLTVPYPWRKRLAYDGELLGALTRIFVSTVLRFYAERMKKDGAPNGQSGAVVVVQRTSSDLKLNPHLHVLFLDGAYRELGDEAVFRELPRLSTREVGEVLDRAVQRMTRFVRRRERSGEADASYLDDDAGTEDAAGLAALAASAVDGRLPRAPSGGASVARCRPSSPRRSPSTSRSAHASTALPCTPPRAPGPSRRSGAKPSASTCSDPP
jgi:hypothetical protein